VRLLMVYNFGVEEAHVSAPNFYQRCAESVFPDFGVETEFLPNFRVTWIFRLLVCFGVSADHAKLLCLFGWLVWNGRRYDAIVGWVTNGLIAAALKHLLLWRNTKVVLILYRLPLFDHVTNVNRIKKAFYLLASAGADVLFALDSKQALEFAKYLGRSPSATKALKYGVDVEWYEQHGPKELVMEKLTPVIFSPGSAHRDDRTLETAISQLPVILRRYQLDASRTQRSSLERLGRANIERKFNFDYHDYLKDCTCADIVVIAVENGDKPVGLTSLLESMALGCPIIITSGASSRDYVHDGINALVYEQGNAKQLKEKIELLLNQPELATKLGKAAKESASTKFALPRCGQDFFRLLDLNSDPS
jgi:glycosyltransferase involved in cell wall biosynthesis